MHGKLLNYSVKDQKVELTFEHTSGRIEIISPWIMNVFVPGKYDDHYSRAIENRDFVSCIFQIHQHDEYLAIQTSHLEARVYDGFYVDFYDGQGTLLCQDFRGERTPLKRRGKTDLAEAEGHLAIKSSEKHKIEVIKTLVGDEIFYGLGDKTGHFNKRGYEYEMWNSDIPAPHVESHKALYKSIPFFITLTRNTAYGLFFDNTFKTFFDLGKEANDYFFFAADDGNLDYYFVAGPEIKQVVSRYTALTGTTPLPQMWTLGYHQSRWSYAPEARVMEIANGFKKHGIPIDAIHLDVDYMDGYRVFTWDRERFPDPEQTTKTLERQGIKIITIIDPGVKRDKGYSVYDDGLEHRHFATDADGITYVNRVWPGASVFPDFSDETTRTWWAEKQKIMTDSGVAGIWNDMNEPASFDGPLPDTIRFKNDGRETDHTEIHNIYGHLMAKATFDGLRSCTNTRPFVITRACYAGTQKYATVWTGDNQSFWDHLRLSIPQLLNLGLSGFAFTGCDIGGFSSDCNPELLSRWIQTGCFSTLFRNHTSARTRDQEPWCFGEQTLEIYKKYVTLRYKLLPYLYDLMWEAENTGLPPMRPLSLHYQNDIETHEINDQFLFGSSILVAPVVEQGKRYRATYLPPGKWFDYWTKEQIEGGRVIISNAPLDTCPIYIQAGAIIPNYPPLPYVGEKQITSIILDIYPGDGKCTHYQDDGASFNYKNGEYNLYRFTQTHKDNTVFIKLELPKADYQFKYHSCTCIYNSDVGIKGLSFNGAPVEYVSKDGTIRFTIPAETGTIEITRAE